MYWRVALAIRLYSDSATELLNAVSAHIEGDGATIFEHACKLGFEGIISKHRARPYRSGPSKSWSR